MTCLLPVEVPHRRMSQPQPCGHRPRARIPGIDAHDLARSLGSRQDWALVRRAVDDGYALVTHNRVDFTSLMKREPLHPGLVCLNVAHGLMRLDVQRELFRHALTHIGDTGLAGHVLEITLAADRTVRVNQYASTPE